MNCLISSLLWPVRARKIICYHCQQAGEKAVKALYLAADIPGGIPRKHDLWFLLEQIKGKVDIPETIFDAAEELDPYAIIVRYWKLLGSVLTNP